MTYADPAGIIVMAVILDISAILFVVLRFVARRKQSLEYGADDWTILAAVVWSTGFAVLAVYGAARKVLGVTLNAPPPTLLKHIEVSYFFISTVALGLIKLSLAFLYRRIFDRPRYRLFLNAWIAFLILYTLCFLIVILAACGSHLTTLFKTAEYVRYCTRVYPTGWALVGADAATDLVVIVIPIPMIWSLRLPALRKLQLSLIFVFALFSLACSIAKAYIYIRTSLGLYDGQDAYVTLTAVLVWMYLEVQVGIMVACAPLLRCMFPGKSIANSLASLRRAVRRSVDAVRSEKSSKHQAALESEGGFRPEQDSAFVPMGSGKTKTAAYRVRLADAALDSYQYKPPEDNQVRIDTTVSVEI